MKKALQISIAQTLFTVEDDAYERLEKYLAEIKDHFKDTDGREEIIADIENRIAEQLLEKKLKIINLAAVEEVLEVMGTVEDFDDSSTEKETTDKTTGTSKKLYRDPENMLIAGVCSGLGAYFGIDPIWIRLAFIGITFLSGFGILLYFVLWFLVPEAKTKSQRLEMAGSPVTVETLSEKINDTINERVEEIKSNKENWKSTLRKIINFPFKLLGKIMRGFFKIISPVCRVCFGLLLVLTSLAIFVGVTVASGFAFSPDIWITNDISLQMILSKNILPLIISGMAFAILIPVFFVLLGGLSIIRKKSFFSSYVGFSLLGIWLISLIISGFGFSQIATNYSKLAENSEAFQATTISLPLDGEFQNLKISDGISLKIIQDTTVALTATGKTKTIDKIAAKIENGTLVLERKPSNSEHFCLFCFYEDPELILTVPDLADISVENGSSLRTEMNPGDYFKTQSLKLTMNDGSYADLVLIADNFKVYMKNGSDVKISGRAGMAEIIAENGSYLNGKNFKITNAKIFAADGSNVKIGESQTLNASADSGSSITYLGNPEITQKATDGSVIKPEEKEVILD
jgi:phage shock protein PspC (stress-responsive transcriptional regulator)